MVHASFDNRSSSESLPTIGPQNATAVEIAMSVAVQLVPSLSTRDERLRLSSSAVAGAEISCRFSETRPSSPGRNAGAQLCH